jgi:protein-tyrosine phosphatase
VTDIESVGLEGAYNFRDLGGLTTKDGRRVVGRRLFRSDTLQELTEGDAEYLVHSLKIKTVVDLRSGAESVEEGRGPLSRYPICYINIPLVDVDRPHGAPGQFTVNQYLDHLETDGNLVRAIEVVSRSLEAPTIVHCAAGKDRTGVLCALILLIVGVTEDEVIKDYAATSTNMVRIRERFSRLPRYARNMARLPDEIYRCEPSTMQIFIAELKRRYRRADAWALAKGIDSETVQNLKSALTLP